MAFMKRDVNMGLLLIIIASIILFSGFSVYYQTNFKNVSMEYQTKLDQLSKVSEDLANQRQELNKTYSLRVKAEEDRKTLDERYQDVNEENERLRNDNSNLQSEVSSTKSQLGQKSAELESTKSTLDSTKIELVRAEAQRDTYKDRLDDVCDAYTSVAGTEHNKC